MQMPQISEGGNSLLILELILKKLTIVKEYLLF